MSNPYIIKIKQNKHKRKITHQMILTSDDVENSSKHIRFSPNTILTLAIIVCSVAGAMFGLIYYERTRNAGYEARLTEKDIEIANLELANSGLSDEIDTLNDKIVILSNTVTTKTASEAELTETLEAQAIPSEFPLSGSATIDEAEDDDVNPMIIFNVSEGVTVVSSGSGTVSAINTDDVYGNVIVIDHGNGYQTIYKNVGEPMVHLGDTVSQGAALYVVGSDNKKLIYQMLYNDTYINPLDVLSING